jgi:hypothetical protein
MSNKLRFFSFLTDIPPKRHVGSLVNSGDQNWAPNWTVAIDKLPGEVLLEIFDHYRQSFDHQIFFLRVWNNKNGWFKLAHVCHKWRCIVLASPRRLRVLLFFAESTPTRAAALESQSLSHLPIHVDYSEIVWNASAQTRLISALRYLNRVVRIAINGSRKDFDKICKALDLPFPALLSFELHNMQGNEEHILLASSFMTSVKSLRHLRLANVRLSRLLPLLSATRALVYLNLTVDTLFWQTRGASLLTHLQRIPHLREIQITTQSRISNHMRKPPITTVSLAELSYFHLSGQCTEIEWFVAGLITPPLRVLRISVVESSPTLHISHLSKLIRVAGIVFLGARLSFSGPTLATTMFAPPHATRMVTFKTPSNAHLGSALSPMLATLEDVFLCISSPFAFRRPLLRDLAHWRKFFEELRNVKVLRLHHGLATEVADVLRQPTVDPSPAQEEVDRDATTTTRPSGPTMNSSNGSIFTLDLFPLLEKIVVYPGTLNSSIGADQHVSWLESFREYTIARQQVGRPVEVLWNMNRNLPRAYTLPDVDA